MKLLLPLLLFSLGSAAQNSALNQLDESSKRHGKWKVYLNEHMHYVDDSSKAVFWRYAYYDHGTDLYQMGNFTKKISVNGPEKKGPSPQLLDGEYKMALKGNTNRCTLRFDKGEFVSGDEHNAKGELTRKYVYRSPRLEDYKPHTYFMYVFKQNKFSTCYSVEGLMAYEEMVDSAYRDTTKISGDSTFATITYFLYGKMVGKQEKISVKQPGQTSPAHFNIPHGHSVRWYYNGQKAAEGDYVYGKKVGTWKYWHKDGRESPTPEGLFKD